VAGCYQPKSSLDCLQAVNVVVATAAASTTRGGSWSRPQGGEHYCCYSLCCIWTATSCRAGNVGRWLHVYTREKPSEWLPWFSPFFLQSLHQCS
jgi:hypothetical protein